jgi:hypothetical protein
MLGRRYTFVVKGNGSKRVLESGTKICAIFVSVIVLFVTVFIAFSK